MALPGIAAPADTPNVDPRSLSQQAQALAETAPTVTVAADVAFELVAPEFTVEKDYVPPPPPPRPRVTTTNSSSNSGATQAANTSAPVAYAAPQAVSGSSIVNIAASLIGSPYSYGGGSPSGFDCSGFVKYVYAQAGISLPHSSSGIKNTGRVIPYSEAQPGDIVWTPGHVSIFVGGSTVIDSLNYGYVVDYRSWYGSPTFIRIG